MHTKKYDETSIESILEYSKELLGKTFQDILDQYNKEFKSSFYMEEETISYNDSYSKGSLGQLIEEKFYYMKLNNESLPDFQKAGMELKVTPYKINKNSTISSKERLVISMIDFESIVDTPFFDSNAWNKIQNILLIFYLWEQQKEKLDYTIDYVFKYSPSLQDIKIIENDYRVIRQKVIAGKAHELSEADTMYLGACTKASDSSVRTKQPNSVEPAKPRAFSLKNSYMSELLREKVATSSEEYESILKDILVDDFESYIKNQLDKHIGRGVQELFEEFYPNSKINSKDRLKLLVNRMLGINTSNSEEFLKANIEIKTIRISKTGTLKESMSFPAFTAMELILEEWETSQLYNYFLETKFLFVIFKEDLNGKFILKNSLFWNMPTNNLEILVKNEWEKGVKTLREGVKLIPEVRGNKHIVSNNLLKSSNTEVIHMRNHSTLSVYRINGKVFGNGILERDGDLLPNGDIISKQSFWLNARYVMKQIKDYII